MTESTQAADALDGECGHEGWCGGYHLVVKLLAQTPPGEPVVVMPNGSLMRAVEAVATTRFDKPLYHLLPIGDSDD